MEPQYYDYTLNFIRSLGDDLLAAQEGWKSLNSLPGTHELTPELNDAYKALAAACAEFVKAYSNYSK